ncbi:MAG: peptide ABC transporter substrate-binding protein [Candidatus Eremiobacteraeota bacterium]|nr:peptide ABC transporter substrate-binding protein [Candidatus Eremiobacteraeota bacterium]MBV8366868.1 peptide ABC transporter substrate-binding protein [Candidatus Eremiobacteraeota bacterium]
MSHRTLFAIAVAAVVCSSCTKISSSTGPQSHKAEPGVLQISDISDPSTLDPMLSGADVAYQLASYALEYLVQLDDRGNLTPVLCERVPTRENGDISADGLSITYHLRRNVSWQDGQPFTSADVVATWKQVMNPNNPVIIRTGYEVISRIDTPDPHTAVLRLKQPYAPLPTRFLVGIQEGPIPVLPAHLIAGLPDLVHSSFNEHPVGTGPFAVQSWEHNGRLVYVANKHYWRGAPKIDRIIFQAQPSQSTELIGFRSGEIDADFDTGPTDLPSYQTLTGMRISRSPSLRLAVVVMNAMPDHPLSDKRLRHAIAYAIDRQETLHKIIHDVGTMADEFLPAWSWAYTPDVPHYEYDPKKAQALLDEAGWIPGPDGIRVKDGQRLVLVIIGSAGSDSSREFNVVLQAHLRAVGIEGVIKNFPYGTVFDYNGPIRQGHYDLASYTYSVNFDPSALQDDGCDEFAPAGANESRICDREVDRLERQALAIYDQAKRKALYAQIERLRMDDLGTYPLYYRDRIGVVSNDLQGYLPSRGIMPNTNSWQWWLK